MDKIDFFKLQSKNLLKDYNSRVYNEVEGYYTYSPRFFNDIESIVDIFNIDKKRDFSLMNAQHVIAKLSGFNKWTDLLKASEEALAIGKLLLTSREEYQKSQGLLTKVGNSLIVHNWKIYEKELLSGFDDLAKLIILKEEFLNGEFWFKNETSNEIVDFSDDINAQDMVAKIMKSKNLSPSQAVSSSITQSNWIRIINTGWADIAVAHWGHGDIVDTREKLQNPVIEIKLSKDKCYLIRTLMKKQEISFTTAISYFMIFKLQSLGYHI